MVTIEASQTSPRLIRFDWVTILVGFCDANWACNKDDSRSTYGYAFSFGSGVFSWASMKQSTVALSIVEAEYVSAT
ncbi:hypothetical protein DVH24_006968 [Malus domestica]|uniref:Uncharacterized protein n=1 Tax=Malus domestica TaxID=3750 RepID=A0A498I592_MALDO|nr:hypothetical protein DVH24_006968 [Malus domestica]